MLDFGGMSDDEFFLGYDAMIDEDDPDSINYDPSKHGGRYDGRGAYYGGGCCCIALLPIIAIIGIVIFFV